MYVGKLSVTPAATGMLDQKSSVMATWEEMMQKKRKKEKKKNIQARVKATFFQAAWVGKRGLCCSVVLLLEVEHDLVTRLSRLGVGKKLVDGMDLKKDWGVHTIASGL